MKNKTTCLIPGCVRKSTFRGLCTSHYSGAARLVRLKQSPPWEVLEKRGLVKPKQSGGRHGGTGLLQRYLNGK